MGRGQSPDHAKTIRIPRFGHFEHLRLLTTASYEVVHPPPIATSMATVAALLAVGRSVEVRWPTHGKSA